MIQISFPRLRAAAFILAALSLSASSLTAQSTSSPLPQPNQLADLTLPDAPGFELLPQDATQSPTPAPTPSSSSSSPAQPTHQQQAEEDLKKQEKQRLLGVMPQFNVVMSGQAVPLSAGQKMRLALHSARDPYYIGYAVLIGGGYSELVGSHSGYGWGPAGFFKRVGASYADNVSGAIIGNGILPVVLHQDPRYFRMGTGTFGHRFLYAALSTVICRGDNGNKQFNYSNVVGNFIAGAISNAYYPADERGLGLTLVNGAEVTAFGAIGGQLYEFGPDLSRLISRHRHKKNTAAPTVDTSAPAAPPPPAQ